MGRRPTKYIKKILALRQRLWPEIKDEDLWHRKRSDGFVTIPRTMPLILGIIEDLTKGAPAASTYFELWCRAFDEMYVSLSKQRELAFHSGFTGQRAERTWGEKIRKLDELGFISVRPGQAGPLSHALILNPYHVIRRLHEAKYPGLTQDKYNALVERAIEIGADDIEGPPKVWVFAYGSLMTDGWEEEFNCAERIPALLAGYRRAFNKKSVKNWGTKEHPGITLSLEQAAGASCRGIAFAFGEQEFNNNIRPYLRKREACDPVLLPLTLEDGREVQAQVYVYAGKNLLPPELSLKEKVDMVLNAGEGESGTARDYVRNAFEDLKEAGVEDQEVTAFWQAVKKAAKN